MSIFTLKVVTALIVVIALLRRLFDPIIFDKILEYPASSSTDLTDDHAFNPVPGPAGRSTIEHALYLFVII